MKSLKNLLLAAGLAIVVSGCATPYGTQKSFWTFGKGFETTQIASNAWQISFVGNNNTDRALARKYILRKAAELSQQGGFAFFTLDSEQTNRDAVNTFGVSRNDNSWLWGSNSIERETSVIVEVTGLNQKPENPGTRVYEVSYILSNVSVKD
ncbi:CC0125/CC1285 family lipoprotein [Shewanella algae]|uniref:CC0125/CC1285 family lipoprotein n=1 Tax=Shewanella algae TaxID=38313 RepID=UPI0031F5BF57